MSEDVAGRSDLVRTLKLLWGQVSPPRRGPKAKCDVRELVAIAIRIADSEGIAAVSTRRIAEAAGISAMSFYTHIPDKAVLFDLMLDAVAAPDELGGTAVFDPARWRANIASVAHGYRAFLLRHPWVLQISTHRPAMGPNALRSYEYFLSAFDGLGLDEVEMDLSVTLLTQYVQGAVRDAIRARQAQIDTGMSDDAWWLAIAPFMETLDYSSYPAVSRVGPVVGELYGLGDPERAFAFGLERLLDGLGTLIARKSPHPASGERE